MIIENFMAEMCDMRAYAKPGTITDLIHTHLAETVQKTEIDCLGNFIAYSGSNLPDAKTILCCAHFDIPAFICMGALDDGNIYAHEYGDIYVDEHNSTLVTTNGTDLYKLNISAEKQNTAKYFVQTCSANRRDALSKIPEGTFIYPLAPLDIASGIATGNGTKDISTCAALILAANKMSKLAVQNRIIFCFLNRHYYHCSSLKLMLKRFSPDYAIVIENTELRGLEEEFAAIIACNRYIIDTQFRDIFCEISSQFKNEIPFSNCSNIRCENVLSGGCARNAILAINSVAKSDIFTRVNLEAIDCVGEIIALSAKLIK